MNNFLLSWYGITDLRSSMGITGGDGPLLGALSTGKYSHAVVLGYTNRDLADINTKEQSEDAELLVATREGNTTLSDEEAYKFQDEFANTPTGHKFYLSWLKGELAKRNNIVDIHFQECYLEKLNDANGIYKAALDSVKYIRETYGVNSQISLFVSPGTPVMAFSWALAALANPDMRVSILASPDHRKGFETVTLPYQLISTTLNTNLSHPKEFDVIFHLYGEQPLPTAFGIRQFKAKMHVYVTSPKYKTENMKPILPQECAEDRINVDPFSPMSAKTKVLDWIKNHPQYKNVGFNLTGGTKLMYEGAMAACNMCQGVPFYFETAKHELMWLNDYTKEPMTGIDNVDDFVSVFGVEITNHGRWEDDLIRELRKDLTMELWNCRHAIVSKYDKLNEYTKNSNYVMPFSIGDASSKISFSLSSQGKATAKLYDKQFEYENCLDFARYLSGGWLEEYTYLQLYPLILSGELTDLRIGFEVSWKGNRRDAIQEFDVLCTDTKRLFILECKAGGYGAAEIQKLQNNVRNYGGIDARGAMVACFLPTGKGRRILSPVVQRVANAPNLGMFVDEHIPQFLCKQLLKMSGEAIYSPTNWKENYETSKGRL